MKLIRKIGISGIAVGVILTVFSFNVLMFNEDYDQNTIRLASILGLPAILSLIVGSIASLLSFRSSFR